MEPTGMGFAPNAASADFYSAMRPRSKQTPLQVSAPDPFLNLAIPGTARIDLLNTTDDDFAEEQPSPASSSSVPDIVPSPSRFLNLRPRSSTLAAAATQASAPSSSQSPQFAPRQRASTVSNAIPPTSPMSVSSVTSVPGQGAGPIGGPAQKRKRSRVTPDQLTHLERVFAHDRSPTAARRKEISDTLSMQERQTQIWFQNRRAKAKLQESRGRGGRRSPGSMHEHHTGDSPPNTPPELSSASEFDLQTLIHEDYPVSVIPCTQLAIGSWRRIASTNGRHDLVAYKCDDKQSFAWFIQSSGHGFKMEIPFAWIETTEFSQSQTHADQACAVFVLSQPPNFFMETLNTSGSPSAKEWKECGDWTEDTQASNVLRHELDGSTVLLLHALRGLPGGPSSTPQLISPHGFSRPPSNPLSGMQMQIPQPPMMAIPPTPASSSFLNNPIMQHLQMTHGRKRSFSGPAAFHNPLSQSNISSTTLNDIHHQHAAADPSTHSQSNFISPPQRLASLNFYSPTFLDTSFSSYQMSTPSSPSRQGSSSALGDFTPIPISHVAPRSFIPHLGGYSPGLRVPGARRYSEMQQAAPSAFSTLASSSLLATAYTPSEPRLMEASMPSVLHSLDMSSYHYDDASSQSPPRPVRLSPPMSDRSSSLHGALDTSVASLGKPQ